MRLFLLGLEGPLREKIETIFGQSLDIQTCPSLSHFENFLHQESTPFIIVTPQYLEDVRMDKHLDREFFWKGLDKKCVFIIFIGKKRLIAKSENENKFHLFPPHFDPDTLKDFINSKTTLKKHQKSTPI